jgi:hypothetical protein
MLVVREGRQRKGWLPLRVYSVSQLKRNTEKRRVRSPSCMCCDAATPDPSAAKPGAWRG